MNVPKLILLGVGQVASHVAALASSYKLFGTTRDKNKISSLQSVNITPLLLQPDLSNEQKEELRELFCNAKILVSFPPDGKTDQVLSSLCSKSDTIIYISSTAVYGDWHGIVDENTAVDWQSSRGKPRLEAEQYWLNQEAIILRAPGLYGPNSGLHLRLRNGTYRLPPYNTNYISRIHLQDLARIILAAFAKPLTDGSIYLVGDKEPATQIDVIQWLCQKMNLPMPPLAEPDTVSATLKANRRVNSEKILHELNIELEFPTYREGYANCLNMLGK